MSRAIDLTGRQFGFLTVAAFSHRGANRVAYWQCRCSCGMEITVAGNNLGSGNSTTCGCRHGIAFSKPITHEQLLRALRYEPATGKWFWLVNIRNAKNGDEAGCYNGNASGYVIMGIDGQQYYAHVLAWFYMTGKWPEHEVDHIDVDGFNNRWLNLRAATHGQNGCNRPPTRTNRVGYKGVHKIRNRYQAKITKYGKSIYLGLFAEAVDAAKSYDRAAKSLHGEFARVNFEEEFK